MRDYGDPIPEPSPLSAIGRDPRVDEAARMLVPVEKPGRKVRVNVMFDEALVSAIDRVADNRSEFL